MIVQVDHFLRHRNEQQMEFLLSPVLKHAHSEEVVVSSLKMTDEQTQVAPRRKLVTMMMMMIKRQRSLLLTNKTLMVCSSVALSIDRSNALRVLFRLKMMTISEIYIPFPFHRHQTSIDDEEEESEFVVFLQDRLM